MRCFYIVGYHGCGKTTQANLLQRDYPQLNYIGGKSGLDAIGSVAELIALIKSSKTDMVIHGCIFQTEPMIERLSKLTDLRVIVLHSKPNTVKERTLTRGAKNYNPKKFKAHYSFIKKLPDLKNRYFFRLHIVDNNQPVDKVYESIKEYVVV